MMTSYQIVIVSTKQLSSAVKTLLSSRQYQSRFTFILGSALEESDLRRSGVRKSSACFILSDRSKGAATELGMEEDHQNVLRVWSVRKYASRTPVYISNLRCVFEWDVRWTYPSFFLQPRNRPPCATTLSASSLCEFHQTSHSWFELFTSRIGGSDHQSHPSSSTFEQIPKVVASRVLGWHPEWNPHGSLQSTVCGKAFQ